MLVSDIIVVVSELIAAVTVVIVVVSEVIEVVDNVVGGIAVSGSESKAMPSKVHLKFMHRTSMLSNCGTFSVTPCKVQMSPFSCISLLCLQTENNLVGINFSILSRYAEQVTWDIIITDLYIAIACRASVADGGGKKESSVYILALSASVHNLRNFLRN